MPSLRRFLGVRHVNAYGRRSSDASVSPVMDRVLSVCSPNSSHFVGRRLTKSSDLSRPGSHRRYLQGFVSGDSRARAFCRSRIPCRVWASAPISTRVAVRAKLSLPGNSVQNAWFSQFAEVFQTHAIHGFDSVVRPLRTNRQPNCQTAWAAWFFLIQPR